MTQTQAKNVPADTDAGRIRLVEKETVWKGFVHMQKLVFDQRMPDGKTIRIVREVHDHGSAAAILLYDPKRDSVVLVRQFRPAAFVNGDPSFMIEVRQGSSMTTMRRMPSAARQWKNPATRSKRLITSSTCMPAPAR